MDAAAFIGNVVNAQHFNRAVERFFNCHPCGCVAFLVPIAGGYD